VLLLAIVGGWFLGSERPRRAAEQQQLPGAKSRLLVQPSLAQGTGSVQVGRVTVPASSPSVPHVKGLVLYAPKPIISKVAVDGDSTIHKWTVKGGIIGGIMEIEPAFQTDKSLKSVASLTTKGKAPRLTVTIPITSLHSTVAVGADKMDAIMREAMREPENQKITYQVTEMVINGTVPESGSPVLFDTKGNLQVAGVTNLIDMQVKMERLENDLIKFSSSKKLKMTNFKITPPSPTWAGGAIKTDDDVTVTFEWVLGPKE
jgi:polyisoprenoid-binding protein YceI